MNFSTSRLMSASPAITKPYPAEEERRKRGEQEEWVGDSKEGGQEERVGGEREEEKNGKRR